MTLKCFLTYDTTLTSSVLSCKKKLISLINFRTFQIFLQCHSKSYKSCFTYIRLNNSWDLDRPLLSSPNCPARLDHYWAPLKTCPFAIKSAHSSHFGHAPKRNNLQKAPLGCRNQEPEFFYLSDVPPVRVRSTLEKHNRL